MIAFLLTLLCLAIMAGSPVLIAALSTALFGVTTVVINRRHDRLVNAGQPVPRWLRVAEAFRRGLANEP